MNLSKSSLVCLPKNAPSHLFFMSYRKCIQYIHLETVHFENIIENKLHGTVTVHSVSLYEAPIVVVWMPCPWMKELYLDEPAKLKTKELSQICKHSWSSRYMDRMSCLYPLLEYSVYWRDFLPIPTGSAVSICLNSLVVHSAGSSIYTTPTSTWPCQSRLVFSERILIEWCGQCILQSSAINQSISFRNPEITKWIYKTNNDTKPNNWVPKDSIF